MKDTTQDSPFVAKDALRLSEVLERLDEIERLSPTRQRDLKSAIRAVARLVRRSPEAVPANINWLHVQLRRIRPKEHGIKKKTFQNIKSDALKALELTGCSRERKDWLAQPTTSWAALLDRIPVKQDRWKLTQLAQYCSALGVEPEGIKDEHVIGLRTALIEESFVNRPEHMAVNAVKAWNRLKDQIAGWPQVVLSPPPPKKEPWTFPLEAFPESFLEDIDRWSNRLTNPDLLEGEGPPRPLRPKTIQHRRFQIRQAASALVRSGVPMRDITHLAVLVDLNNLKGTLRWMMGRFDNEPTEAIHGLARCLQAIARHHVKAPEEDLAAIKGIVSRLGRDADGLREKNRQRLLQLDNPANMAKLLHLPAKLVAEAERQLKIRPRKAALLMQTALCVEILLNAPMRIGNLATLNLVEHLKMVKVKRVSRTQIHIPGAEVKNGKPLDYELGADATELLNLYLARFRTHLLGEPSDYLFPALNGGPKRQDALSRLITKTILDQTGLTIHPHLFRSIAGKIHSQIQPGDVTTLTHVLGDTLKTVMKSYTQFERRHALEHYQQSVAKARMRAAE